MFSCCVFSKEYNLMVHRSVVPPPPLALCLLASPFFSHSATSFFISYSFFVVVDSNEKTSMCQEGRGEQHQYLCNFLQVVISLSKELCPYMHRDYRDAHRLTVKPTRIHVCRRS